MSFNLKFKDNVLMSKTTYPIKKGITDDSFKEKVHNYNFIIDYQLKAI